MHSSKPIFTLLRGESSLLSSLIGRAERLSRIGAALAEALGPPLAEHCRVANLYRDTLVIFADSPAWGARLRYAAPAALTRLKQRDPTLETVERITVKVRPVAEPAIRPAAPPRLSPESGALVAAVAAGTEDPALKAALARLASRAKAR